MENETKLCTKCRETKTVDCFYRCRRDGVVARCKSCMSAHNDTPQRRASKAAYRTTPQRRASKAAYRASPKGKASNAAYNASPKGKASAAAYAKTPARKASMAAYDKTPARKASKAAYRASPKGKAYKAAHAAANRGQYSANQARRQAMKIQATPPWARTGSEKLTIDQFYDDAELLNDMWGWNLTVEHIIPLKPMDKFAPLGLHVAANLQLMDGSMNSSKSNNWKWIPPEPQFKRHTYITDRGTRIITEDT